MHDQPVIQIVRGDITRLSVDAIVNAANETLLGGGGVDGAIHRAAGPQLLAACRALPQVRPGVRCPTGEVRVTAGFDLPATHVIHTVGPIWHGGAQEADLLAACYHKALLLADQKALRSIAFPAISCGVYGYPIDQAAQIACTTLCQSASDLQQLTQIKLVAFGAELETALHVALQRAST